MKTREGLLSVFISLVTLFSVCGIAGAQTYYFTQSGFSGGGAVYGSFVGADFDNDGRIAYFPGGPPEEVTEFSLSFMGDSLVNNFTHNLSDLQGFVYDIGSGFIGDSAIEGLASNWNGSSGFDYASGYGPTGSLGGRVIDVVTGATSYTQELIVVSDTNVPEPSTFLLLGAGLGGLALYRRKYRK